MGKEINGLKESSKLSQIFELGSIIDLSYPLGKGTPTYPSSIGFSIYERSKIEKNGRKTSKIVLNTHMGTHMDAPAHILLNAQTIDKIPLKKMMGRALILGLKKEGFQKDVYGLKDLGGETEYISQVDILIIKVGNSKTAMGRERLFNKYPVPDSSVLKWIINHKIKCLGTDAVSIEKTNSKTMENHKTLLRRKILLVEGLFNLEKIDCDIFYFMAIPINIKNGDGAPCRAFSIMI